VTASLREKRGPKWKRREVDRDDGSTMANDIKAAVVCLLALTAALGVLFAFTSDSGDGVAFVHESSEAVAQESAAVGSDGIGSWGLQEAPTKRNYDKLPDSILKKHFDVARVDLAGNKVTNEFCGGAEYYEKKKCSPKYEESLAMTSLPLFIMTAITLFIWLLVLCGRNCFTCCDTHKAGCCGGRYPTKGCCLPGELLDADQGYTEWTNRLFLFLVVVILLLSGSGMAVGFRGNDQLATGVTKLLDTTGAIPGNMHTNVAGIQAEFRALQVLASAVNPYLKASMWATIQDGLNQVNQGSIDMDKQVSETIKTIRKYEKERTDFLWCGLWIPLGLCVLALLGYLVPVLLSMMIIPAVLLTALLWLIIGIHVPVAITTADFCYGLDQGLKYPNQSSPLDMLVGCHGEMGAQQMAHTTQYFTQASSAVACTTFNKTMCDLPTVTYTDKHGQSQSFKPVTCPDVPCDETTLPRYMNETVIKDHLFGCATLEGGNIVSHDCLYNDTATAKDKCLTKYGNTDVLPCVPSDTPGVHEPFAVKSLVECNSTCLMNSTRISATKVVGNSELGLRFQAVAKNKLVPLQDCSFARAQATEVEHALCWDVVEATDYLITGLCIIAITFFFGTFIFLMAYKRFHRNYLNTIDPKTQIPKWAKERSKILASLGLADSQASSSADTTALLSAGTKAELEPDDGADKV